MNRRRVLADLAGVQVGPHDVDDALLLIDYPCGLQVEVPAGQLADVVRAALSHVCTSAGDPPRG